MHEVHCWALHYVKEGGFLHVSIKYSYKEILKSLMIRPLTCTCSYYKDTCIWFILSYAE